MKYFLLTLLCFTTFLHVSHAAVFVVDKKTDPTGAIVLDISIDTEGKTINTIAGDVSISSDNVDITDISTAGSVVPLWMTQPKISTQLTLDTRKRVVFEGVLPGGFTGVRGAYYEGEKPGKILSITLAPKKAGTTVVIIENIDIRLNDGSATRLPVETQSFSVAVPDVKIHSGNTDAKGVELPQSTVTAYLTHDESLDNDKWALLIHDDTIDKTPKIYEVAESASADPHDVYFYEWKTTSFPYILKHQARNRFIHIKATYTDGSFTYTTVQPVEKTSDDLVIWRILGITGIAVLLGYVLRPTQRKKK